MTVRVLLADDQTLVRQGLRSLLALTADLRVVGEASDGEAALELATGVPADVMLLDVRMPRRSGLEVLAALAARGRSAPAVILLTTFDDDSVALEGVRLGARGFLLKDVTFDELTDAVRAVARGESRIKPAITARVEAHFAGRSLELDAIARPIALTPRELEVLRLVASGASNREIASALGTVEGTVKNQVSSILAKLGVRDRTRAVLRAIELGLV